MEDIFLSAEAWQAEASLYTQSSLSYDLLYRNSDPEEERRILKTGAIQSFDYGGATNLSALLREMQQYRSKKIIILLTFGDMADFLRTNSLTHLDFATFKNMVEDFRASKLAEN